MVYCAEAEVQHGQCWMHQNLTLIHVLRKTVPEVYIKVVYFIYLFYYLLEGRAVNTITLPTLVAAFHHSQYLPTYLSISRCSGLCLNRRIIAQYFSEPATPPW